MRRLLAAISLVYLALITVVIGVLRPGSLTTPEPHSFTAQLILQCDVPTFGSGMILDVILFCGAEGII